MTVDATVDDGRQITTRHSDEPAIDGPPERIHRKAARLPRLPVHQTHVLDRIPNTVQFVDEAHTFCDGISATPEVDGIPTRAGPRRLLDQRRLVAVPP